LGRAGKGKEQEEQDCEKRAAAHGLAPTRTTVISMVFGSSSRTVSPEGALPRHGRKQPGQAGRRGADVCAGFQARVSSPREWPSLALVYGGRWERVASLAAILYIKHPDFRTNPNGRFSESRHVVAAGPAVVPPCRWG